MSASVPLVAFLVWSGFLGGLWGLFFGLWRAARARAVKAEADLEAWQAAHRYATAYENANRPAGRLILISQVSPPGNA